MQTLTIENIGERVDSPPDISIVIVCQRIFLFSLSTRVRERAFKKAKPVLTIDASSTARFTVFLRKDPSSFSHPPLPRSGAISAEQAARDTSLGFRTLDENSLSTISRISFASFSPANRGKPCEIPRLSVSRNGDPRPPPPSLVRYAERRLSSRPLIAHKSPRSRLALVHYYNYNRKRVGGGRGEGETGRAGGRGGKREKSIGEYS